MKQVKFVLVRHGKNVAKLGKTLEGAEIGRAYKAGDNLYSAGITEVDMVTYSPLPRAIQTAFALVAGMEVDCPQLLEAMPALGNDELFAEMTAPSQFRTLASVKGNYMALYDVHSGEKVNGWINQFVDAFDALFAAAVAAEAKTVMVVIHSPVIEMMLDGVYTRQEEILLEDMLAMSELDAVVFDATQDGEGAIIKASGTHKIPAPVSAA